MSFTLHCNINTKLQIIPAITLKTVHSVGRSGMITCIGIQNGGLAVELKRHKKECVCHVHIFFVNRSAQSMIQFH